MLGSGVDCTAVLADMVGDKVGSVGSARAATRRWDRADRQWAAWDVAQQGKTCRFQAVRQKHTKRNSRKESKGDMSKAAKSRDKARRLDRQLKDEFVRQEQYSVDCFADIDWNWWNGSYYSDYEYDQDTRRKKHKKRKPTTDDILLTPCPLRKRVTLSPVEKRKTQKTRRPKYVTPQAKERQTLHLARQKVRKARSKAHTAARQDKNAFLEDVDVDQQAGCRRQRATAGPCRVRTLAAGTPTGSAGCSTTRISGQGTYKQVWPGEVLWEALWASEIVLPEAAVKRVVKTRKAKVATHPKYVGGTRRHWRWWETARLPEHYTTHTYTGSVVPSSMSVKSVTYLDASRCGKGTHPTLTAARQAEAASAKKEISFFTLCARAQKVKATTSKVLMRVAEKEKESGMRNTAIRHHLSISAAQRKAPRRRRAKTARSSVLAATILDVMYQ